MMTRALIPVVILGTACLVGAATPAMAEIIGDRELLRLVAEKHKENFESILTWQGKAVSVRSRTVGGQEEYRHASECELVYDQMQHAVRWNKHTVDSFFQINGQDVPDPDRGDQSVMITPDALYVYRRASSRGGKDRYDLSITTMDNAASLQDDSLDPRYFYSDPGGTGSLHRRLMFLYASESPFTQWHVSRSGDRVTLSIAFNETELEYVFDLAQGGNLISYANSDLEAINTTEYSYRKIDGVWVMATYKWTNHDLRTDDKPVSVASVE